MINPRFVTKEFDKEMKGIIDYSIGYLEGINSGKSKFLAGVGASVITLLKEYIDSSARINPEMLQHVYEWNLSGSPDGRLFDIDYTISNLGLSFKSSFRQSTAIKNGATEPFYSKAKIMEDGIPVTISPKRSEVLAFDVDGRTVFTRNDVIVDEPGGSQAKGGFEKTFDSFFGRYFSQAFLHNSGILQYLNSPVLYKKNLTKGSRMGKAYGRETGYKWIVNASIGGN